MPIVRKEDIRPYLELTLEEFLDKYDLTLEITKKGQYEEVWYDARVLDLYEITLSLYRGLGVCPITSLYGSKAKTEAQCLNEIVRKINNTSDYCGLEIIRDYNENKNLENQANRQDLGADVKIRLVEEET